MRKEVVALRRKLSEQEHLLRDTMENLRTSSRTKDSMEQFIVNQCELISSLFSLLMFIVLLFTLFSFISSVKNTRCVETSSLKSRGESFLSFTHFFYNLGHVSISNKTSFPCYTLKYV